MQATAHDSTAPNTSALEPILSPREASQLLSVADALERILSPREASQLTGVAVATLAKWRWAGHGGPPFIRIGARKVGYRASTVRLFLRERASTADHEALASEG